MLLLKVQFLTRVHLIGELCVGLALLLLIKVAFSRLCLGSLQSQGMKQSWHDLVLGGNSDGSRPCLLLEIIISI